MKRLLFLGLLCCTLSAWAEPQKVQFFPVSGLTLGVSNYADARRVGAVTTSSYPNCYEIADIDFWDHDKNGIFEHIYIVKSDTMPREWSAIGMSWELSYNEWSQLFRGLGFTLNVTKAPTVKEYDGRSTLSAELQAVSPNGLLSFELNFNYGDTHTTSGQGTLYGIRVDAEGTSVADYVFTNGGGYVKPVPTVVSSGAGSFFPIYGSITPGVTSRSDLQQRGWTAPDKKYPDQVKVNQTTLMINPETNLVRSVSLFHPAPLPPEWEQLGLDWSRSYDECIQWFRQLGYSVDITTQPHIDEYGRLDAEFEAKAPNGKMDIQFEFRYRPDGNGKTASDKNTLGYIYIWTNGVVDASTSVVASALGGVPAPTIASTSGSVPASETSSPVDAMPDSFRGYAKDYVEQKINEWQKKGRYEKTADWQVRVTEATREAKIRELTAEAEKLFIAEQSKQVVPNVSIVDYDADNEVFMIRDVRFGDLLVPVPIARAEQFEKGFASMRKSPKYFIDDDRLALSELVLTDASGHSYTYSNQASLNYAVTNIDYNFDPIEIDVAEDSEPRGRQNISTVSVSAGKSDVDMNIPAAAVRRERSFAVIIANEHYQSEAAVEFATRDGEVFAEYCRRTLGLPNEQVRLVTDATLNNMRAQLNWLEQVTRAYEGDVDVIFYYAGHGIPDEASKSAYLLPVDGYGSDVETGLKVADLYSRLGAMPARSVSVFLDACFSGARRDGEMMVAARGVAISPRSEVPMGNMVVFTAAQNDETAYPYREKQHGLFTYYLLKKLQETKGAVTFGELGDYISREVSRRSVVVNAKGQTPAVVVSPRLADSWREIALGK